MSATHVEECTTLLQAGALLLQLTLLITKTPLPTLPVCAVHYNLP